MTMTSLPTDSFHSQTFMVRDSTKCACLIAGYRGSIDSYKGIIKALNKEGYTVFAYQHDSRVITSADSALLPQLVDALCADFAAKSQDFTTKICTGASIGAGLCFAVQQRVSGVGFGIYAGAGVSPPENIFEAPLFYFVRKKFRKAGISPAQLKQAWREVDILPEKPLGSVPFVIVLGKRDKIVSYRKALTTFHGWQAEGARIEIITHPLLGHTGIINWYKRHFTELLVQAEGLSKTKEGARRS